MLGLVGKVVGELVWILAVTVLVHNERNLEPQTAISSRSRIFYFSTGTIPAELGDLTDLTYLDLNHNKLTGP